VQKKKPLGILRRHPSRREQARPDPDYWRSVPLSRQDRKTGRQSCSHNIFTSAIRTRSPERPRPRAEAPWPRRLSAAFGSVLIGTRMRTLMLIFVPNVLSRPNGGFPGRHHVAGAGEDGRATASGGVVRAGQRQRAIAARTARSHSRLGTASLQRAITSPLSSRGGPAQDLSGRCSIAIPRPYGTFRPHVDNAVRGTTDVLA